MNKYTFYKTLYIYLFHEPFFSPFQSAQLTITQCIRLTVVIFSGPISPFQPDGKKIFPLVENISKQEQTDPISAIWKLQSSNKLYKSILYQPDEYLIPL